MNGFFGVGPLEMLVVGVLALIFIGPQRLPAVIQQVMKIVNELRSYADQVREELTNEFEPIKQELQEITGEVTQFAQEVTDSANEIAAETKQVTDEVQPAVNELMAPPPPRSDTPPLPSPADTPAAFLTNGVAHEEDEDRPAFVDYRPA